MTPAVLTVRTPRCSGANEDVGWSDPYNNIRTFVKGSSVGREQEAYLQHVIRNYDRLSERTIFMHGRRPSCGFGFDPSTASL